MSSTQQAPSIQALGETIKAVIVNNTVAARPVNLSTIRTRIAQIDDINPTRADVDHALTHLMVTRQIRLIPESCQRVLTPADRAAGIWLGGETRHVASIA